MRVHLRTFLLSAVQNYSKCLIIVRTFDPAAPLARNTTNFGREALSLASHDSSDPSKKVEWMCQCMWMLALVASVSKTNVGKVYPKSASVRVQTFFRSIYKSIWVMIYNVSFLSEARHVRSTIVFCFLENLIAFLICFLFPRSSTSDFFFRAEKIGN